MSSEDTAASLDAYRFYEQTWDGYDDLYESFEWEVPEQFNTAAACCDDWVERAGDQVALVVRHPDGERSYTYGDLRTHADRLANYLREQGIERGDRIAVHGVQRVESLVTHLAAWKLGAISIPLSMLFGPDALRFRLQDSDTSAFVVAPAATEAFRAVKADCDALHTSLVVGKTEAEDDETAFWDALDGHEDEFETVETDAEDTAMIIYTSGTTGSPKGVVHAHRGLLGILPGIIASGYDMELREDDVARTPVEWSWVGSLNDLVLPALYFGVPVVADARPGEFDPAQELSILAEYDVTVTGGPPTAYRFMLQHPALEETDLSSLRSLVLGGEAAGQTLVERARAVLDDTVVHEVYGQSEAPLYVGDTESLGVPHREGSMGKPHPGHEVTVRDPDTGEELPPGEVGEIAVRHEGDPICFTGYWNRPDLTDETVRDGWQYTDDLGKRDEDGYLHFHSRKDDVIISSGYKVGPAEVEDTLSAHEAVANAGVIGVPDETRGELVKAYVVPAPDHEPDDDLREELQTFVKERLAKYEYPRELEFLEELPKTTTGKVRRKDLREREGIEG